jgi:ubiquinone/menaquinone biosynthesis C-methylase UbiE
MVRVKRPALLAPISDGNYDHRFAIEMVEGNVSAGREADRPLVANHPMLGRARNMEAKRMTIDAENLYPAGPLPIRSHLDALLMQVGSVDGQRILDIGCGEGALGRKLAGLGAEVTGIDPNMPALDWEPQGAGRFRIVRAAAEALPLPDASIDVALFIFSLHHLPDVAGALREAHRVLSPTGKLYVAEPLAEGDSNAVTKLFHDEATVRRDAADIMLRVAPPMFRDHADEIYIQRRFIPDFDSFADRMIANLRFNEYPAEAVTAPAVRAKFEEIASRTNGHFDQPVRIDCFIA